MKPPEGVKHRWWCRVIPLNWWRSTTWKQNGKTWSEYQCLICRTTAKGTPMEDPMTDTTGAYEAMEWRQVDHEDWCPQKPPVCECEQDSECACLRSLVLDARSWARHGFEIGQRSCTWSDSGVAPDWLIQEHDYAAFANGEPRA